MKAKLIKFCYKAVEEKMLKIYATIMTTTIAAMTPVPATSYKKNHVSSTF